MYEQFETRTTIRVDQNWKKPNHCETFCLEQHNGVLQAEVLAVNKIPTFILDKNTKGLILKPAYNKYL